MILSTEIGLLRHNSTASWEKSIHNMSLYRCITVDLFVYSPSEEHLAGFQFLIIRNRAAMNIHVQILYEYKFFIFKHKYPGVWLLSYKVSEYLSLGETAELFSEWLDHSPTSTLWVIQFLCSFAGGQHEELRPLQRSWGRRLGIRKGVIKPQETPCSWASNPKTRVCFMLSPTPLTLWGALPYNRFSRRRSKLAAPRQ